jgi:hypothetical protein
MTSIVLRDLPKTGGLESCNLYIKDAVVFYATVHDLKKKYNSEDREYSVTVFVDEDTKDKLLDEVMVNKGFALVGKDKTSKPPRRIKYPLSSQVEEGKVNYDIVDGMYGFSVAKPEFSKKGNPMSVNVIGADGSPFTENVGNGSVCTLKLFGYRNQDSQLCVTLDTLQVLEHVPYEGKTAADSVEDDVLGVSYKVQKAEAKVEQEEAKPAPKDQPTPEPEDDLDESPPF